MPPGPPLAMYMGPASRPLVGPASEADVTADQSTFGKAGRFSSSSSSARWVEASKWRPTLQAISAGLSYVAGASAASAAADDDDCATADELTDVAFSCVPAMARSTLALSSTM